MRTTPYELVFGQPPRQNIFPSVVKSEVMEEDIEDILKEEEDKVKHEHLDSCDEENKDNTQDENQGGDEENRDKSQEMQDKSPDGENQDKSPDGENQDKSPDGENQDKSPDGENQGKSPDFLATTEKHRQLREAADKQYRLNAERMKLKYCKAKRKKVLTFSEGDFVSVRIPRMIGHLLTFTDYHVLWLSAWGLNSIFTGLRYITKYIDWY